VRDALERWVLELLQVPPEPHPPAGSPDSLRIFRGGANFYKWSLLQWGGAQLLALLGLVLLLAVLLAAKAPPTAKAVLAGAVGLLGTLYLAQLFLTYVSLRLNYRLRWYIVTDRCLRIRSGIWNIQELTMTFSNIQEIRVSRGPLQRILGLGDVQVSSAGGGGSVESTGHVARFAGIDNADAIRDLLVERLRQYRDSGLGEPVAAARPDALEAAREVLAEVRALGGVIG
jgi:membrane protein YdbS with pleckstrin-like domain